MVVVTGAPGHLGNNLVRALLRKGARVRAMALPGENLVSLEGLNVEVVEGDVRDISFLCRAFEGAETVYHLASVISLTPGHWNLLEEVNVRGTRNVAEACLKAGVRRLVYTSSIHALVEPPHGTVIDESTPCDPARIPTEYGRSKAKATLEVLEATSKGLDAVVVFPTGVIGPYDFKPSEVGQFILHFARGKVPVRLEGGFDFVDVRDAAQGHILAAERGRTGEKYILAGEWISVEEVMEELSRATGVPMPRLRLGAGAARTLASLAMLYGRVTGKKPLITRESVDILRSNSLVSSEKARRELGYSPRPIRDTIRDTVGWFRKAGLIER